jgi:hypothetical protein
MGMHNSTDRMRRVIRGLTTFYEEKHHALKGQQRAFADEFDPDVSELGGRDPDEAYYAYIEELSKGVDEVLEELGVELEPVPPGDPEEATDETLMAGARMLKWNLEVVDRETGEFVGRLEWGMYHRHDRFAIPGPPQITYLKAAAGNTMIVS